MHAGLVDPSLRPRPHARQRIGSFPRVRGTAGRFEPELHPGAEANGWNYSCTGVTTPIQASRDNCPVKISLPHLCQARSAYPTRVGPSDPELA